MITTTTMISTKVKALDRRRDKGVMCGPCGITLMNKKQATGIYQEVQAFRRKQLAGSISFRNFAGLRKSVA
jgi:hypothetical protein